MIGRMHRAVAWSPVARRFLSSVQSAHRADYGTDYHIPVMKDECLHHLNIQPDGIYLDCTLGGGGHSAAILDRGGRVVAIDQDPDAISASSARLQEHLASGRLEIHRTNFRHMRKVLENSQLAKGRLFDGVLMDLGISSYQIDAASRGFSFSAIGPLDMRMHRGSAGEYSDGGSVAFTAATMVNEWRTDDLADVLYHFGEETRSRQIAREVVLARPINSTEALQQAIGKITSFKDRPKVMARCFQALRIAVNDELPALEEALESTAHCVRLGGRLVVLSYHSLEDRRVKHLMRTGRAGGEPLPAKLQMLHRAEPVEVMGDEACPWKLVEKRAQGPSDREIELNRRSRSAKLRVAERIDPTQPAPAVRVAPHVGAKQTRKLAAAQTASTY